MKKFFRMVSMFALAGATLAYTGCTDYDEDIEAINDRIDMLETGKLKTVEDQVASLNKTVADLQDAQSKAQSAIEALQKSLTALQTKHDADIKALEEAYKAADASLKTSIENQIKTLTDQFNAEVKKINAAISGLQSSVEGINTKISNIEATIKTLATKDYVDATFATKQAVADLNTELGKLSARLEIAEKAIDTINEEIDDLKEADKKLDEAVKAAKKAADDAQTAADKAQGTADAALGTVTALQEALGAYAVQGALEAKIAALMEMDEELDEKKFNTADFQKTFDAAFDKALDAALAEGGKINKEIASQIAAAKKILDDKIDAVESALNKRIDKVLGVIEGRLTSIAFVPEYYYDGVPSILFETIAYDGLSATDENAVNAGRFYPSVWNNSSYANEFKYFASALATAKYRLNPRNVGADCADFSFVGDKANYIDTRAVAPEAPIEIFGTPSYDETTGYVKFQIKKNEKFNTAADYDDSLDIVALKAVLKKGLTENEIKEGTKPEVYSEYAHVNEVAVPATLLTISDKQKLTAPVAEMSLPEGVDLKPYKFSRDGHAYVQTVKEAQDSGYVYEMAYDKDFDLGSLIATCYLDFTKEPNCTSYNAKHTALDLEKYGFHYEYSVAKTPYEIADGESVVDQQKEIVCLDAAKGIFGTVKDAEGEYVTARVGRMPIVRVDLMHGENIVTRAFIKLIITGERQPDMTVCDTVKNVVLACPDTRIDRAISEADLAALYESLNITKEEFWAVYGVKEVTTTVQKNGEDNTVIPAPKMIVTDKAIKWGMTHAQAGKIGTGAKIVTTITLTDKRVLSALPKHIKFQFEVNFTLPKPEVTAEIKDLYWKGEGVKVLQANVNVPESKTDVAANCYFKTPIAVQPWTKLEATNLPCPATDKFGYRISRLYNINNDAKFADWTPTSGVNITPAGKTVVAAELPTSEYYIELDKSNEKVKKALNSDNGLVAEVQWYVTAQSGDEWVLHTFLVNFIRPLNFTLPDGLEVTDAVTGGDVVAFQDKFMLTDWRPELVFGPTYEDVVKTDYIWVKACSKAEHAVWVPAYQKELTPATYEFETQTVKISTGITYYEASYQLEVNEDKMKWYLFQIGNEPKGQWVMTEVVSALGRTPNEAEANVRAKINKMDSHYLDEYENCGRRASALETEKFTSGSEVKFQVVSKVTYTPATYEIVEGYFEYSECNPQPGPAMNGEVYTEGQRIGCWMYQRVQNIIKDQMVDPGQYWNFYGPIGEVHLDLSDNYKHVKTSLPDGNLPSGAELEQVGNTVKYVNVMSPIQYEYYIYIPASIDYGWGTLNQTLVIKVKPAKSVAE